MAYIPGNFIHVTPIKFQFRVFLIPWFKRNNGVICCTKGRDYNSSSPMKYIPKKPSKNVVNEAASLPVRYLEKGHNGPELNLARVDFSKKLSRNCLDVGSENHNACLTSDVNSGLKGGEEEEEIEGGYVPVSDEFSEEPDKVFKDSRKGCHGIQSGHSLQDVEKMAIQLLASRAFTAVELKKKLQAKRFPLETVDAVITDFQSRGLINDCLYAETYSRSRWSSSSWGPRRIRQALFKRGITEADAENAIKIVFENDGDGGGCDSGVAMSEPSLDQLYVQASKQWQRSHGASQDIRKSRMVRWLQYRGFDWSVVKYVLKKLESESPS